MEALQTDLNKCLELKLRKGGKRPSYECPTCGQCVKKTTKAEYGTGETLSTILNSVRAMDSRNVADFKNRVAMTLGYSEEQANQALAISMTFRGKGGVFPTGRKRLDKGNSVALYSPDDVLDYLNSHAVSISTYGKGTTYSTAA